MSQEWSDMMLGILNALFSSGAIAGAVYLESGDKHAAAIAGAGALVQHFRGRPRVRRVDVERKAK